MSIECFQSYIGGTPSCPVCRGPLECEHFIGWFEKGKLVARDQGRRPPKTAADGGPLRTDILVNTGVSTRVYRD
jgi:hypothetical protein